MALATLEDVEARLGRSLTETESTRADGLLDEASELVSSYLGYEDGYVPDPVPNGVVVVVSRMVARVLLQGAATASTALPLGAESVTLGMGPFNEAYQFGQGTTSGAPWLSATDKTMLRRYRSSMSTVSFSSDQTGNYRRGV